MDYQALGELWTQERGPWVAPWQEIPRGVECVVRLRISHRGYTFTLLGSDNYWLEASADRLVFGVSNDPDNRWGLPVNVRAWEWRNGADSQELVETTPSGDMVRGVWVPPELDPWGIADGTREP